jgi:hypothetical protein
MTMTLQEKIVLVAKANGWELAEKGPDYQVWVKPGPMINRDDPKRLRVQFTVTGNKIRSAYFGPDDRPHLITRSFSAVDFHLTQTRAGQRA